MPITKVSVPVKYGFCSNFVTDSAAGKEIIQTSQAGKKIHLKFISLTNNTAGALTFTVSGAANIVGPFEINALTTVTMSFPLDIILAAAQNLELTVDAGSVSGIAQGFLM